MTNVDTSFGQQFRPHAFGQDAGEHLQHVFMAHDRLVDDRDQIFIDAKVRRRILHEMDIRGACSHGLLDQLQDFH